MASYHRLLAGGAIMLGGLGATMIVHGGWQPAAAAVTILGGTVFLLSFISLAVATDRPRSDRPEWAQARRTPPPRRPRHATPSPRTSRSARTPTLVDAKTAPAVAPSP
jgi:hypothetical protein